jgi:acetyltransferase-like isoleucine patch superfamily enzyme
MRIKLLRRIVNFFYNKKNDTQICSTEASLKAEYEKKVLISPRVTVTDDVKIGKYSYVNVGSSVENCTIGNYCSISSGVWICPFEHQIKNRSTHPFAHGDIEKREPVKIGNDVLISLNSIILSGVTVGDGAVIGAGAVVTKDVQPYEIVGGVPAKHIGWRFDSDEQQKISDTKWWNYDVDVLQKNLDYFKGKTNYFNP